jgi:glucose/arabinose dehydrogenase
MSHRFRLVVRLALLLVLAASTAAWAQQRGRGAGPAGAGQAAPPARGGRIGVPAVPLGDGPWVFDTAEQHKIRVSVVTKGLVNPWSLLWLPDGSMLVSERPGRLRLVRDGVLDPQAIGGLPAIHAVRLSGFMDLALHPQFAQNQFLYFTYSKPRADGLLATALGRGRLDVAAHALRDVEDLFVAEPWWDGRGGSASRIAFGRDGMLYMSVGSSGEDVVQAQMHNIHKGKVLRLRDDGSAPPDNPFVGKTGYRPEIYSLGHRNSLGLVVHPGTGEIWNAEMGPQGGDEVNIVRPGRNYGWPLASMGRDYDGPWQGRFGMEGMESPLVYWMPAISVSGLLIYDGDQFPAWRGNAFVGGMTVGRLPTTGHLQRIVFNENTEEQRREIMLWDLHQRIRDVRQGPDGLIYLLTDETGGAVLKIDPAP